MWHFVINSELFAVDFSNLQKTVCNTASLRVWLCVCMYRTLCSILLIRRNFNLELVIT